MNQVFVGDDAGNADDADDANDANDDNVDNVDDHDDDTGRVANRKSKKDAFARGACAVRVLACRFEVRLRLRGSLILIVSLQPARQTA